MSEKSNDSSLKLTFLSVVLVTWQRFTKTNQILNKLIKFRKINSLVTCLVKTLIWQKNISIYLCKKWSCLCWLFHTVHWFHVIFAEILWNINEFLVFLHCSLFSRKFCEKRWKVRVNFSFSFNTVRWFHVICWGKMLKMTVL